jgi:gp16 family phage-associated protein
MTRLYTSAEVKKAFRDEGVSLSDWAAANGFSRQAVYAALGGRTIGSRGEAHRVAVALRMKPQPAGIVRTLQPYEEPVSPSPIDGDNLAQPQSDPNQEMSMN